MEREIKQTIEEFIKEFDESTLDNAPTYAPSQKDIIDLIDNYWVSRFRDNQKDELGFLKPFYNIVVNPTQVAAKMIDLDTKDIQIKAEDGQSYYPAWLFQKELVIWMKDTNFGKILNEIIYNLPKYGSVVLKKVGNDVQLVPLQNLVNNPTVRKLTDDLIIEVHEVTPERFSQLAEKHDWEIDEVKVNDEMITFYEVYGENLEYKYNIVTKDGVILHQDNRDCPYKELHWDKIEGRWLGVGQVERLFEAQIQTNRIEKYKSQALHWTSKRVWQTRDDTIKKNLMTDVKTGDLLFVNSEVNPVSTEERNLHAYVEAEQRWEALKDRLSFSYDVIRGERAPAGTPLGSAILQTRMAGGWFDLKREEIGIFLREVLFDWVIPQFAKEKRKEHKIMLGEFNEDELTKLRNLIITNKTNKEILNLVKKGKVPSAREVDMVKSVVKRKVEQEKELKIPRGYYDNLKYKIKITITNEQVDVAAKMQTLQTVLTMLATNPTILQDPRTKRVFYQLLDLAGISPVQFEEEIPSLEERAEVQAQRGGSLAKVPEIRTPAAGIELRTA